MAKKGTQKTKASIDVSFERADDTSKRLPTRAEMTAWMQAACQVPVSGTVRFVGREEGQALNAQYRNKDYATNILTFDYQHEPEAQADWVICTDVLRDESKAQGKSFRAHLAHLLIHGVLHAQGWDHETDEEAAEMEALETELMLQLGFPNPYSDRAQGH